MRPAQTRRAARAALLLSLAASMLAGPEQPARALTIRLDRVASGLDEPVAIAAPRDGSRRLFVVERRGRIKLWKGGRIVSTYLDIRDRVRCCEGETGMLGLAFHPKFASNGKFFVAYTDRDDDLRISEFDDPSPSGNSAPAGSEDVRLQISHADASNHWGGALQFGARYLYVSTGDGGGSDDRFGNAQDKSSLLGKILRLDMDRECGSLEYCVPSTNPFAGSMPGRGEIWHYGLRNPWRFAFDRANWNMWIGDVGDDHREEIDFSSPSGGKNFEWPCREGDIDNPDHRCTVRSTGPVYDYGRSNGRCAVIGGHVVRDSEAAPRLEAWYVFGDYCSGEIWRMRRSSGPYRIYDHGRRIVAFGEAQHGNVYMVSVDPANAREGRMYRLET